MALPDTMVSTRRQLASATPDRKLSQIDRKSSTITQTPKTPFMGNTAIVPSSLESILLYDWWLVKADSSCGRGLAVGGFASRERAGPRVFYSAAISKRHGANILEATDGIVITVTGLINRSRTHENGFPPEVYSQFLFGFPFNWQDYVSSSSDKKSAFENAKANTSQSDHKSANQNLEPNLDDFAGTRLQYLLLSTHGESSHCIFSNSLNSKCSSPMENVESGRNETTKSHSKKISHYDHPEADIEDNGQNDSVKDPSHAVQEAKSKIEMDFPIQSKGVYTRSMTRLESSRNKQKETPLSSDSQKEQMRGGKSSCENSDRRENVGSNVTSTNNIAIRADKEAGAIIRDKTEGRRSSLRLRNRKQNQ